MKTWVIISVSISALVLAWSIEPVFQQDKPLPKIQAPSEWKKIKDPEGEYFLLARTPQGLEIAARLAKDPSIQYDLRRYTKEALHQEAMLFDVFPGSIGPFVFKSNHGDVCFVTENKTISSAFNRTAIDVLCPDGDRSLEISITGPKGMLAEALAEAILLIRNIEMPR